MTNPTYPTSLFEAYDIANPSDNAINEDGTYKLVSYDITNKQNKYIGSYRIMASFRRRKIVRSAAFAGTDNYNYYRNPGDTKYGKLAEQLRGISILRGGREISLDTNWLRADLTIDRWVALSIDFDPSLDSVFGISNDKQRTGFLSSLAQIKTKEIGERDDEYEPNVLKAAKTIQQILGQLRSLVNKDTPQSKKPEQIDTDPSVEATSVLVQITASTSERVDNDSTCAIDGIDNKETKPSDIKQSYKDLTSGGREADRTRPEIVVNNKLKVDFVTDPVLGDNNIFIPINTNNGVLIIKFNGQHPLYKSLERILSLQNRDDEQDRDDEQEQADTIELKDALKDAVSVIRCLFYAYSRAELEAGDKQQSYYQKVRLDWGIVAKDVFDTDE